MRKWGWLAGALAFLQACATAPSGEVGRYPGWLIAAAEPAAPAIGMAISLVEWRDGYLDRPAPLTAAMPDLRPLDVLLFSNKHRLSGHTGAGLFGHSAVYLGSEKELKALGLWNDPAVVPYREDVRAGATIVESAQSHGTALAPVGQIVATDRLVILRPRLDPGARRAAIARLFGLVGTPFDHHYRLSDSRQLFCTELIERGLPQLALPRRAAYGREVILPDDIALAATAGRGRLRFVTYLRGDGTRWERASAAALAADIAAFD